MKNFRNPFVIVGLAACVMVVAGSFLPWIGFLDTIVGGVAREIATGEIEQKKFILMGVAVVSVLTTIFGVLWNRNLFLVNVLLGGFSTIMMVNQMPSGEEIGLLNVDMILPGFYLSLAGVFLITVVGIINSFKKIDYGSKKG